MVKFTTISIEKRPLWSVIVGALLYTSTIYVFYLVFHYWSIRWIAVGNKLLFLGLLLFNSGTMFSTARTILFDSESKQIKVDYSVGVIRYYSYQITDLQYISVFLNPSSKKYEINLWYKKNKHIKLSFFKEFKIAYDCGLKFSNLLDIDLLDATQKGDFKWVDKSDNL
jgi:hypothetical protein